MDVASHKLQSQTHLHKFHESQQKVTKKLTVSNESGRVGSIHAAMLQNKTGKCIDTGTSIVSSAQINKLKGNYEQVTMKEATQNDAIIVRTRFIPKPNQNDKNGRLISTPSTKELEERQIIIPEWISNIDPKLDIKSCIQRLAGMMATANSKVRLASVDLSNAYARINAFNSKIYLRTKDNKYFKLSQPIQGLAPAGRIAPNLLWQRFSKLDKKLRKKFKQNYLGLVSYSDNALILYYKDEIIETIRKELGELFNKNQFKINQFRALGFRFKLNKDILTIRKPIRLKKNSDFYNHILGNKNNCIKIKINKPVKISVDGVSIENKGTCSAIAYQDPKFPISGITVERNGIDQLIAEAYSIILGDELSSLLNIKTVETDSEICTQIKKRKKPRCTIESNILKNIKCKLNFIPGNINPADPYTRELKERYLKKKSPYMKELVPLEPKPPPENDDHIMDKENLPPRKRAKMTIGEDEHQVSDKLSIK